jgi:cadmium resistance protein CadD (predicted permease)
MQNKQTAFFIGQFVPSLIVLLLSLIGFFALFNQASGLLLLTGIIWCALQQAIVQKKTSALRAGLDDHNRRTVGCVNLTG